jgi:hypothetical protein
MHAKVLYRHPSSGSTTVRSSPWKALGRVVTRAKDGLCSLPDWLWTCPMDMCSTLCLTSRRSAIQELCITHDWYIPSRLYLPRRLHAYRSNAHAGFRTGHGRNYLIFRHRMDQVSPCSSSTLPSFTSPTRPTRHKPTT